jgi:hypothetical protein
VSAPGVAGRGPLTLTQAAHAGRGPQVAHATATAHAHAGRAALARRAVSRYAGRVRECVGVSVSARPNQGAAAGQMGFQVTVPDMVLIG